MRKNTPLLLFVVLVLVTLSCGWFKNTSETTIASPTPSPTKPVQSAIQLLNTKTPTPIPVEITDESFQSLPVIEASICDWTTPITPTQFTFGGNLYFHIPKFESTQLNLYGVNDQVEVITALGSYKSGADRYLGPLAFISPNGEWMFVRTDWISTDEEDTPPPILLTAIDLSEKILIPWEDAWDVALGWWDDEHIIILPMDGEIAKILLLNVFSEETIPFPLTENASELNLPNLSTESRWRGQWGVGVVFNHSFTQLLRFAFPGGGGLVQNNIGDGEQLFALDSDFEYPYYPALEGIALWSPDDQYTAVPLTNSDIQELFLIDANGDIWQVTNFQDAGFEDVTIYPGVWSHNGMQLALDVSYSVSGEEINNHIFILDLEAEEIRAMCTHGKPIAFSPDDAFLAYYGNHPSSDIFTRILIIDPVTGEEWLLDETKNWHIIDWIE